MLTQARIRELLDYNPDTGEFVWRIRRGRIAAGTKAGSVTRHGYIKIDIDYRTYMAHRLAFLWMNGNFPEHQVDHINRVCSDNRWDNLRDATPLQNNYNKPAGRGLKGACRHKSTGKWVAQIRIDGRVKWLGSFDTEEAAHAAYCAAAKKLHGEFYYQTAPSDPPRGTSANV